MYEGLDGSVRFHILQIPTRHLPPTKVCPSYAHIIPFFDQGRTMENVQHRWGFVLTIHSVVSPYYCLLLSLKKRNNKVCLVKDVAVAEVDSDAAVDAAGVVVVVVAVDAVEAVAVTTRTYGCP